MYISLTLHKTIIELLRTKKNFALPKPVFPAQKKLQQYLHSVQSGVLQNHSQECNDQNLTFSHFGDYHKFLFYCVDRIIFECFLIAGHNLLKFHQQSTLQCGNKLLYIFLM